MFQTIPSYTHTPCVSALHDTGNENKEIELSKQLHGTDNNVKTLEYEQ